MNEYSAPYSFPDYSDVELSGGQYAGGSNGAQIQQDPQGNPYLVKQYADPNQAASEALANSVYRTMGAQVPNLGFRNGAISYPLVDGETQPFSGGYDNGDIAKRQALGKHYATDALVGNYDFAGLDDDNVLWDEQGNPIRIDPGGSFEFRAQGKPKEYAPHMDDLSSGLSFGQAKHGVLTSDQDLRRQAAEIAKRMHPQQVDQLVNAAPFTDEQMRERVRSNLNNRVNWMNEYANGSRNLSPEALRTLEDHANIAGESSNSYRVSAIPTINPVDTKNGPQKPVHEVKIGNERIRRCQHCGTLYAHKNQIECPTCGNNVYKGWR